MNTIKKTLYRSMIVSMLFLMSCSSDDTSATTQFTFPENQTIFLDSQEKLDAFGAIGHTVFN